MKRSSISITLLLATIISMVLISAGSASAAVSNVDKFVWFNSNNNTYFTFGATGNCDKGTRIRVTLVAGGRSWSKTGRCYKSSKGGVFKVVKKVYTSRKNVNNVKNDSNRQVYVTAY